MNNKNWYIYKQPRVLSEPGPGVIMGRYYRAFLGFKLTIYLCSCFEQRMKNSAPNIMVLALNPFPITNIAQTSNNHYSSQIVDCYY